MMTLRPDEGFDGGFEDGFRYYELRDIDVVRISILHSIGRRLIDLTRSTTVNMTRY